MAAPLAPAVLPSPHRVPLLGARSILDGSNHLVSAS